MTANRLQDRPNYYQYARENIRCECPLCFCPYRDKKMYSFVYICEKKKIIFYNVPKCASTTIRKTIFSGNSELSLRVPKKSLEEYFKFTFVRNPWDRMVSNWRSFTTQPCRVKQLLSMSDKNLSKFEDFVDFTLEAKNHHWQPQVLFLPHQVDFIGKVETFEQDFLKLCEILDENPKKNVRSNVTRHAEYSSYYTPLSRDIVSGIYQDDIQTFGYKFGT